MNRVGLVASSWILTVLLVASGARAQEAAPVPGDAAAAPAPTAPAAPVSGPAPPLGTSHFKQGALGLIFGSGYRGLVRYKGSAPCGQEGKDFCTSRLPAFMDIQAAYGVTRGLSVITDFRVGLEQDFTHSRPLAIAPGIKAYIDPEGLAKFFATIQLAFDLTGQAAGASQLDVGIRNANGLQFDLMRFFGVFVQFGETIAFRRFFRFELDLAVGLEGRFP
jgi:hypothetical protein